MSWILLTIYVVLNVAGQLLLKRAAMSGGAEGSAHRSLLSLWFLAGGGTLGVSMLLWVQVLRGLPLNVAHPMTIGGCLALIALASRMLWSEPLPRSRIAGIAVILVGVVLAAPGAQAP